jgi:hypothetical protein
MQFLESDFQKKAYLWINQSHDKGLMKFEKNSLLEEKSRKQQQLQQSSLYQSLSPEKIFHIPMIYQMDEMTVIQQISKVECIQKWSHS